MSDITSDKIRELLSNPENINLIANIANGMSGGANPIKPPKPTQEAQIKDESPAQGFASQDELADKLDADTYGTSEPDAISVGNMGLPGISESAGTLGALGNIGALGSVGSDKRIALLKAIKPYVSDNKKEKVDGLVKAISVAGILNNYKGFL